MSIAACSNGATSLGNERTAGLRAYALAALAWTLEPPREGVPSELAWLHDHARAVAPAGLSWLETLEDALRHPTPDDLPLLDLAKALDLQLIEVLAVALAAAVEDDIRVGRALATLQAPLGGSRPTLGLLAEALRQSATPPYDPIDALAGGNALATGLLRLGPEGPPLPERVVGLPLPLRWALRGRDGTWPGATIGAGPGSAVALPVRCLAEARAQARGLKHARPSILAVRGHSTGEGRAAAELVAAALGRRAVFLADGCERAGLAPWLLARGLVPVLAMELAQGDRREVPTIEGHEGPTIVLSGPEGSPLALGEPVPSWTPRPPDRAERRRLWGLALGPGAATLAEDLAWRHRQGAGRIAHLGRQASRVARASGRTSPTREDVATAALTSEGAALEALAHPLPEPVRDEALVLAPALKAELETLLRRCECRDVLAEDLGPAATTRFHPGVRALLLGPSGTGKTLAAGWLATRLGLPLFRVDLAAVLSKYIGEIEKNLAKLMDAAERSEVVLLFDEADALFARRTEVREANDRFANSQTNYLLQRIETFDGIALLTSNSRARFDSAFSRRLDMVLEFPMPGPEERRRLWLAHLGAGHAVSPDQVNRLSLLADVSGGVIRGAVLHAAVLARVGGRAILARDLFDGLAGEFTKLGQPMPADLDRARRDEGTP